MPTSIKMEDEGSEKVVHLPATSGPRPFKCEVCQRSFRELATLRKHEQLHRADRPYVCTTCGKSFLWSSNLKVHERVHTGERPYKCKICHRCFTQSNDLRRHERNVHMRGKLMNYRSGMGRGMQNTMVHAQSGHVNLAAYQAFAMQQRALLQHALTYESLMQNAVTASQSHAYMQHAQQEGASGINSASVMPKPNDLAVSTSSDGGREPYRSPHSPSPIKLEQVTPPSSPKDPDPSHQARRNSDSRPLSSHSAPDIRTLQRQLSNEYSKMAMRSSPGVMHSPPALSSYLHQNSLTPHTVNGSPPTSNGPLSLAPQNGLRLSGNHGPLTTLPQPVPLPPISSLYRASVSQSDPRMEHMDKNRVIDLSMKSMSSGESSDGEWKEGNLSCVSKSPHMSETESEEKRAVTTTSETPPVDSGIHHCPHCNIFFHDFTMYHLHQSLHSPEEEDPFRCPSCQKQCQDRIEFMFHIVWHVKYPHTIPNYQPFKETYLAT